MTTRSIYPLIESDLRKKNLSKNNQRSRKVEKGTIFWNFIKGIIFIFCLTLFFVQSATFLQDYYTYPTTNRIEFTYPDEFEYPAITFCSNNILKRTKFCDEYPDLCEIPENLTDYCDTHRSVCKENPRNPLIPKQKDEFAREIYHAIRQVYFKGNITREFWEEWTWSVTLWMGSEMKPAFIPFPPEYVLCYTHNLLLNDSGEPKKFRTRSKYPGNMILGYLLNIQEKEKFLFELESQVFVSIHSPFHSVNPFFEGNSLRPGYKYKIILRLGEERLIEHPYDTNCANYTELWRKNNRQGPRSQQMCKDLCLLDLYKQNKNMTMEFGLLEYPLELCLDTTCQTSPEDRETLERCRNDCKLGCRILKYTTTFTETAVFKSEKEIRDSDSSSNKIEVRVFLGDRQVVVQRYIPVYPFGHLFSYIGGLMGFWLGVSVWAFAGIAEMVFRSSLLWMKRIKRYFRETS